MTPYKISESGSVREFEELPSTESR